MHTIFIPVNLRSFSKSGPGWPERVLEALEYGTSHMLRPSGDDGIFRVSAKRSLDQITTNLNDDGGRIVQIPFAVAGISESRLPPNKEPDLVSL